MQTLARRVDDAVAQQRERVCERHRLRDRREHSRHRADREQGSGEEERQDREHGRRADEVLLLRHLGRDRLRERVHEHGEQDRGAEEPGDARAGHVELAAAQRG